MSSVQTDDEPWGPELIECSELLKGSKGRKRKNPLSDISNTYHSKTVATTKTDESKRSSLKNNESEKHESEKPSSEAITEDEFNSIVKSVDIKTFQFDGVSEEENELGKLLLLLCIHLSFDCNLHASLVLLWQEICLLQRMLVLFSLKVTGIWSQHTLWTISLTIWLLLTGKLARLHKKVLLFHQSRHSYNVPTGVHRYDWHVLL